MPRIAGIDIPEKKKIYFASAVCSRHRPEGRGRDILVEAKVNPEAPRRRGGPRPQLAKINEIIDTDLRRGGCAPPLRCQQNIQRLKDVRSYRGERHRRGLPTFAGSAPAPTPARARARRRRSPARRASRPSKT